MKKYLFILIAAVSFFVSCKKDKSILLPPVVVPPPAMDYINLHDSAIEYAKPVTVIDLDGDGFSDLKFGVVLVGDPINQQDKRQYMVSSGIHSKLPVNTNGQVPVMSNGDLIPLDNFGGYNWWLVSSVLMVQRIENVNGDVSWVGPWKGAIKKYLPFQMLKNNQRHNGWVELSVDVAQQKIVLHGLALSREGEKQVKAGDQ